MAKFIKFNDISIEVPNCYNIIMTVENNNSIKSNASRSKITIVLYSLNTKKSYTLINTFEALNYQLKSVKMNPEKFEFSLG